ncbi:enoyl-CoA hydratase/isomerase family protein [Rhodococcus koreensis]|uniref:enoyl-CoA hydratase/isomerase family protein n=1 Tax=Rhodococcus koreensis TaxID=99653 RepID=UPI003672D311
MTTAATLTTDVEVVQLLEHPDGILEIRMNRPKARNALNSALRQALFSAFRTFEADPTWNVAILTAEGSTFCAGGDLKEMAEGGLKVPGRDFVPQLGTNIEVTKPVISVVNGPALAGGFLIAQMCDLCIASESATFGISEAKWGRGAPWAVPLHWMIPQRVMLELLMTAEPVGAERAKEFGLVNAVVPDEDLFDTAMTLARKIARNAPLSVRAAKHMVRLCMELPRSQAENAADELYETVYLSEDAQEGPAAFKAKRDPVWKGK